MLVIGAVALSSALFVGGWIAAALFQSPAQIAAAARPPKPSVIVAPVSEGELADVISTQGEVISVNQVSSELPTSAGVGSVTLSPLSVGDQMRPGQVVLEINNAPLFALPGTFPFFRDMKAGDTGRDIEQLQQGLNAAGYSIAVDGSFGSRTEAALRDLYRSAGYELPETESSSSAVDATDAPSTAAPDQLLKKTNGVSVPVAAFLVVRTLPATVVSVPRTGAIPEDARVVTSSGDMVVKTSVVPTVAAQLSEGMSANMQTRSKSSPLTLTRISEVSGEGGNSTFEVLFSFSTSGERPEAATEGVVLITREVVADESLIVPSTAVPSRGDQRYVMKKVGDDFVEVSVTEDGTLNGSSAISVIGDGQLEAGDEVRVK